MAEISSFIKMVNLLKRQDQYDAHIKTAQDTEEILKRETLQQHTALCQKYIRKLIADKDIARILERLNHEILLQKLSLKAQEIFDVMFNDIMIFHDVGKCNPLFQKNKMKNPRTEEAGAFNQIGAQHSMISAICYINYFVNEIKKLENIGEKKILRKFMLINADAIARHHSSPGGLIKFGQNCIAGRGSDAGTRAATVLEKEWDRFFHGSFTLANGKLSALFYSVFQENVVKGYGRHIAMYTYGRLIYSLLVAADYYATTEFMQDVELTQFGKLKDICHLIHLYGTTPIQCSIRTYEKEHYPMEPKAFQQKKNINILRNELFLDAENQYRQNRNHNIFYLEAPTGSGKSNASMNLGFQMLNQDKQLEKIFYIYPFNTLVEQNIKTLEEIFGDNQEVMGQIAVVNSTTPIKLAKDAEADDIGYYQKALLDRQFLHYPLVLSTHVSFFNIMFGQSKESAFGFHQLINSVIILDEIQSYNNMLWGEIIHFLQTFSKVLNMKVIIMSATLPKLDYLTQETHTAINLIADRDKYFSHPCFRNRVQISYELMGKTIDDLYDHLKQISRQGNRILAEFIKKETAKQFYFRLKKDIDVSCDVELMTGEDSVIERQRILNIARDLKRPMVLVATQVVEAGVDIDMDIGYKNISKLDSEEQFMGRINRSCRRSGIVYFFKVDDCTTIYKHDVRRHKVFTLENPKIRNYLQNKQFGKFYELIMAVIVRENRTIAAHGLSDFFHNHVGWLDYAAISKRMKLIDDNRSISVYLAHRLETQDGSIIDGAALWGNYKTLLQTETMSYAEKRIKLSELTSQMNHFIYQMKKSSNFDFHDLIGQLYYIEDGEKYFTNGKRK